MRAHSGNHGGIVHAKPDAGEQGRKPPGSGEGGPDRTVGGHPAGDTTVRIPVSAASARVRERSVSATVFWNDAAISGRDSGTTASFFQKTLPLMDDRSS